MIGFVKSIQKGFFMQHSFVFNLFIIFLHLFYEMIGDIKMVAISMSVSASILLSALSLIWHGCESREAQYVASRKHPWV